MATIVSKKAKVGEIIQAVQTTKESSSSEMVRLNELANTLKTLKTVQLGDVSKEINDLKMFCANTVDSLFNNIITKIEMLDQLEKAINFQKENLNKVHNITVEATTLESILAAQEEQKKTFEESMEQIKDKWIKEREQYEYIREVAKRKDADDFEVFKKNRIAALEETYKAKMQEVLEREAVADKLHKESLESLKSSQMLEEKLQKDFDEQVKKKTDELTKQFNFDLSMNRKDAENAIKLAQTVSNAQVDRIRELEKQLADSRATANLATERVQQIAEKAIENASKSGNSVITSYPMPAMDTQINCSNDSLPTSTRRRNS